MPNLLLQSEDFSTTWVTGGDAVVAADVTTSPSGSTNADRITASPSGANRIQQTVSGRDGVVTYSIFAKQDTASHLNIRVFESASVDIYNDFNLVTGASAGSNSARAPLDVGVIPQGDDWYRIYIQAKLDGADDAIIRVGGEILSTSSGTAFFLWGANVEPGNLGKYTPTTTIAALTDTRNLRGRRLHKRSQS